MSATCLACGSQFRPQRSTARFCSPHCRVTAQRARDRGTPIKVAATRPSVTSDAVLSVTATLGMSEGQKQQSVTLRRKPPKLDPRIVPDPKWPGMYRLRLPDGSLSDLVNLPRAKDALAVERDWHLRYLQPGCAEREISNLSLGVARRNFGSGSRAILKSIKPNGSKR